MSVLTGNSSELDLEKAYFLEEIEQLRAELLEARFYSLINDHVSKILVTSGNIDRVARLIKAYLNLHTCYINYDIDATSLKANVAGLATTFGQKFIELVRKMKGIPFRFTGEIATANTPASLNAAEFLKNIDRTLVLPPACYSPILPAQATAAGVRKTGLEDFLHSRLGELLIVPLRKYHGVLILIKKEHECFTKGEKELFETLGRHIAITLDNIYQKYHDELGIKNITFFRDQLKLLDEQEKPYAVLFIKLKGLQKINDEYSYTEGNNFIFKNIAKLKWVLKELHFENVNNLVARTRGVILMVVLPGLKSQEELNELTQLIKKKLVDPYSLADKKYLELGSSIRIGGCLSLESEGFESLLNKVNDALYIPKPAGSSSSINLYNKELEEEKEKYKYIRNIFKVMEQDGAPDSDTARLFLHYQPKFDLRDNTIIGFEALIRLGTERYGLVEPGLFIGMAEKEDFVWLIDKFVIREVCKQIKEWAALGTGIPVSLNISRYSIRKKECIGEFEKIFNELDFFAFRHLLKIEVPEAGLLDENCLAMLKALNKKLNLRLSIDDLGKADANLYTLLNLYVNDLIDDIKIEKLYIDKLLACDERGNLLKDDNDEIRLDEEGCNYMLSLLNMFNGLFLTNTIHKPKIICEGIEYKKQAHWLKEHDFIYAQGYYLGEPASAADYEKLLLRRI